MCDVGRRAVPLSNPPRPCALRAANRHRPGRAERRRKRRPGRRAALWGGMRRGYDPAPGIRPPGSGLRDHAELVRGTERKTGAAWFLRSGRVGRRHAVAKRCLSSSVPPHAAMTESTTSKRAGSCSCSRSLQMVEATGPRSPHRLARSQNDGLSAHTRNCLSASMNSPGVLAVPESAGSWAERPFSRTPFVPACPATLYGARPRSGRCGPRARQGAAGARAVRCGR